MSSSKSPKKKSHVFTKHPRCRIDRIPPRSWTRFVESIRLHGRNRSPGPLVRSWFSRPWGLDLLGMVLATSFAPMFAAGTSALLLDWRTRTGGLSESIQRVLRRLQRFSQRASAALLDRRMRTGGPTRIVEPFFRRFQHLLEAVSTHLLEWRSRKGDL